MIEIDDKVISSEVFTQCFCCDIAACKGKCCVHGDSGAPLLNDEAQTIESILSTVEPYTSPDGLTAIKEQGCAVIDSDGDLVTPLRNGEECAFAIFENGVAKCAIEKAWFDKKVNFRKPISCQLYPIRAKQYETFTALNYDIWRVCKPARELGEKQKIPVFRFLKEPIIRAYGEDFYAKMEEAYSLLLNTNQ